MHTLLHSYILQPCMASPALFVGTGVVAFSKDPSVQMMAQVFKQGGQSLIHLGDSDVEYHPGFQLYMTTPLANPHYLPEVCIKVTLVNFTVTGPGLEEQLLAELVRKERPDLQASKDRLLLSISNDKRQLKVHLRPFTLPLPLSAVCFVHCRPHIAVQQYCTVCVCVNQQQAVKVCLMWGMAVVMLTVGSEPGADDGECGAGAGGQDPEAAEGG